ncbi:MAG: type 1 glutamine amidotransferase [Pyrinomonadaceae bacterium]
MIEEQQIVNADAPVTAAPETSEPLPFPFNQRAFCRYEPIEKRIEEARVLVVNNLLREDSDISDVAREEWGRTATARLNREREISRLALNNILHNVERLVKHPELEIAHVSEVAAAAKKFQPQAIVLSGTLSDFDFYHPGIIESFGRFVRETRTPVLGICGGHQLVGLSFGARVVTLDNQEQHEHRDNRACEYQYRFIRITAPDDPIFNGIDNDESGIWQDYTTEARILRVWQNHGLQLDHVPEGFEMLATAYLCRNQMMVKRTGGQLIYTVQFHLEKSFEDWSKDRATRWEHPNESRDGRIIFENFLRESLKHINSSSV